MHLRKLLLLVSLAVATTPAVALAQQVAVFALGGPGPGGPMQMPLMMVIRHTNLTQDQQKKTHQIMSASFAQAQPLMKQLRDIHDQIADKLMSAGTVTAADIAPLQKQENQIHQQLDQQMLSTALQIRGLLTPGQLAQAAALNSKLKSLRQQMDALVGENGPPMGPPAPM
jgi:Spy/CpxP family protein refolding chaperone